ncbi:hypothetical protein Tco_0294156 [Tanacetum coccineum]
MLVLLLATFTTFALGQSFRGGGGGTRVGFYRSTCRNIESIVQSAVRTAVQANPNNSPRLCYGCSSLLLLLNGFELLIAAKSQLETTLPSVKRVALDTYVNNFGNSFYDNLRPGAGSLLYPIAKLWSDAEERRGCRGLYKGFWEEDQDQDSTRSLEERW